MVKTKFSNSELHRFSQPIEDVHKCLHGLLKITWDKMLEACRLRSFLCFNLGGDSGMTGTQLTVTTDRASDGDHWQRSEAHAVRTQTHQFDHIRCRANATVCPDLHSFTQT